jgi:hypothetical protein
MLIVTPILCTVNKKVKRKLKPDHSKQKFKVLSQKPNKNQQYNEEGFDSDIFRLPF